MMNKEILNPRMEKYIKGLAIIFAIFIIFLIVSEGVEIKEKASRAENTISVSGTGEVYLKPDLAQAVFSVITEKDSASDALNENSEKMNSVINFIKEKGVEEKDIKTTSFNIYPRYEWRKESSVYPSGERVLAGYEVRQSLQVKIRDMLKIGEILEGGVSSGANSVSNLKLAVDDEEEAKKRAREKAIEDAKEKAKELSSQLGVKLEKIVGYGDSGQTFMISKSYDSYEMAAEGLGGAVPEIETGENKITATVSIVYKID